MFEFLKIGAIGALFAALLILTLALDIADHQRDSARAEVETLSADLVKQNAAVEQMKNESTKQISNLLIAQKEAEKERTAYAQKAKKLMAQNVSSDCNEAIKWGAKEGAALYQCWMVSCKA